jgi:hypothetical protein
VTTFSLSASSRFFAAIVAREPESDGEAHHPHHSVAPNRPIGLLWIRFNLLTRSELLDGAIDRAATLARSPTDT